MSFLCNELFSPVKKADNGYSCHCHHNRKQNAVYRRIKTELQPSCLRPQHRHKICRNMPKNCHGKLPCFFQHKRKKQSDHRRIQKLPEIQFLQGQKRFYLAKFQKKNLKKSRPWQMSSIWQKKMILRRCISLTWIFK